MSPRSTAPAPRDRRPGLTGFALLLAASGCAGVEFLPTADAKSTPPPAVASTPIGQMSIDEVAKRLEADDGGTFLFDTDGEALYASGHLPRAKWVGYGELPASALPADKRATLIFYCLNETCGSAERAAASALNLGYPYVFRMGAGIDGWRKANKAVER